MQSVCGPLSLNTLLPVLSAICLFCLTLFSHSSSISRNWSSSKTILPFNAMDLKIFRLCPRAQHAFYMWSSICTQASKKFACMYIACTFEQTYLNKKNNNNKKKPLLCMMHSDIFFCVLLILLYFILTNHIAWPFNRSGSQNMEKILQHVSIPMLVFLGFFFFFHYQQLLWEHILSFLYAMYIYSATVPN